MWKIIVGGVLFAALALWVLSKGGNLDMSGEKHGIEVSDHPVAASAPASLPASAAVTPASAASQ
jgi:hypothetical protein